MDYSKRLINYPKELFCDSFKASIDVTKSLFEKYKVYINKPIVKCCLLGNTSTGKSTLLNVLLEKDILYEGDPEGTSCAAICQSISNGEDYFDLHCGSVCLKKHLPIDEIKNINKTNENYFNVAMDIKNYLNVYLNVPNHWILKNISLIDCPGYNVKNLDDILHYCDCVQIMIFCFRARAGVTDFDIDKINKFKRIFGKFKISFIINCCDECDSIDKDEIINRLSPHLTGEDAIFFISTLEEKNNEWHDERHEQFEKFKKCLLKQKSQASNSFRKVFGDLYESAENLLDYLKFTNFRDSQFSDNTFTELQKQIFLLINNDKTKYYKDNINTALMEYSDKANEEISKFMAKQFVNDYNLNDGIINENYFYKDIILNDVIPKPIFSWYNWGVKNEDMQKSFRDYFIEKRNLIKRDISDHYRRKAHNFLNDLEKYKKIVRDVIQEIAKMEF